MNKIGIIAAMQEESDEIVALMKNISKSIIYGIDFFEGKIEDKEVIVVKSGIGKVNIARTTQILIDNFKIEYIINVGAAGALDSNLNIGDIVIGDKLIQHDFDLTAFNYPKGYITGVGDYIDSEAKLVEKLGKVISNLDTDEYKCVIGTIASGDIFCTEIKMKEKIFSKFNAKCVEMEGAAAAQVCYLDKIPFVVVRSISDSPNGNNAIVFDEFVKLASKRCAVIIRKLLEN